MGHIGFKTTPLWLGLLSFCLVLDQIHSRHVPPQSLTKTSQPQEITSHNKDQSQKEIESFEAKGHHPDKEIWLDDYTKDFLYEMQADSAGHKAMDGRHKAMDGRHKAGMRDVTVDGGIRPQCPPPPEHVPSFGCDSPKCHSDKECQSSHHKCCYNGCTFTCLATLPPPTVIDWWKEPPRRLQSGNSWLVPGPEENSQVEPCSTSHVTDEDDLLCPHGFICHIENPGDLARGVPNWGHCVKQRTYRQDSGRMFKLKLKSERHKPKNDNGSCTFESSVIKDGATFWYDKHPCTCSSGSITCKVGPITEA
jgi:hypothetical protein